MGLGEQDAGFRCIYKGEALLLFSRQAVCGSFVFWGKAFTTTSQLASCEVGPTMLGHYEEQQKPTKFSDRQDLYPSTRDPKLGTHPKPSSQNPTYCLPVSPHDMPTLQQLSPSSCTLNPKIPLLNTCSDLYRKHRICPENKK